MAELMQDVDERTRLADTNRLEVLLFSLGQPRASDREAWYGINVFKVREVLHRPEITCAPNMPAAIEGMVTLRGAALPVINLVTYCGTATEDPPQLLVVTEYNQNVQGFLVHSVDSIVRMSWEDVKTPPALVTARHKGLVTAVAEVEGKGLIMIMDVEKVLAENSGLYEDEGLYTGIRPSAGAEQLTVLYADDSDVARGQVRRTLAELGMQGIETANGRKAWERLQAMADEASAAGEPLASRLHAILTDIEMPEMDGYMLTSTIKADARFTGIPVLMHSSLSGVANEQRGKHVGADGFITKFEPRELAQALTAAVNAR